MTRPTPESRARKIEERAARRAWRERLRVLRSERRYRQALAASRSSREARVMLRAAMRALGVPGPRFGVHGLGEG